MRLSNGYDTETDYRKVVDEYNALCKATPQDKQAIKALLSKYGGRVQLLNFLAYQNLGIGRTNKLTLK